MAEFMSGGQPSANAVGIADVLGQHVVIQIECSLCAGAASRLRAGEPCPICERLQVDDHVCLLDVPDERNRFQLHVPQGRYLYLLVDQIKILLHDPIVFRCSVAGDFPVGRIGLEQLRARWRKCSSI